jgi:hypothetical protein
VRHCSDQILSRARPASDKSDAWKVKKPARRVATLLRTGFSRFPGLSAVGFNPRWASVPCARGNPVDSMCSVVRSYYFSTYFTPSISLKCASCVHKVASYPWAVARIMLSASGSPAAGTPSSRCKPISGGSSSQQECNRKHKQPGNPRQTWVKSCNPYRQREDHHGHKRR